MTVYLALLPLGSVYVMARAEGPGGVRGDVALEVGPGEAFLGWTHAELAALGEGPHDLRPRAEPPPAAFERPAPRA